MDVLKQAPGMMTKKLSLSHQIVGKIAMVTPENFDLLYTKWSMIPRQLLISSHRCVTCSICLQPDVETTLGKIGIDLYRVFQ